jgi:beta-carotene hydroxylase
VEALPAFNDIAADLARPTKREAFMVLARPFLCTLAYVAFAYLGWWPLAPVAVFCLFVAIVTSAHDAVHGSLGLSKRATEWALFALGCLVLESGHAYRLTHLRHHKVFPGPDDPEGEPSRMTLWQSIAHGPSYLVRLFVWAWQRGVDRPWLFAEAAWMLSVTVLSLVLARFTLWPLCYVAMVLAGSWSYPLLTSHLPHKDYGDSPLTQTHTLRGRIIPALFLELTFHLEHHLYPRVPTHKLHELSRRLEPYFARNGVTPWRVP